MDEILRVSMDDLETNEENIYLDAVYRGKPFTGVAYDEWDGGRSEIPYIDGVAHGRVRSWFANGRLSEDETVEHGETVESTLWWPPGDVVRYRKTAESERYYDRDGTLYQERTAEHLRRYYASGTMQEEILYGAQEASLTYYAPDGTWAVRGRFPYTFRQSFALERERMSFHDAYIQAHAETLLAAEPCMSFQKYFVLWLPKLPKKRLFAGPPNTPPQLRQVICDLIRSENLHVKYYGINLAGSYRVTEAVPLLREALSIQVNPGSYGTPVNPSCAGYAHTIAQRAQIALKSLGQ